MATRRKRVNASSGIVIAVAALIALIIGVYGGGLLSGEQSSINSGGTPADDSSALTVVFIDVGQGDSELIICDGKAMLIDAGVAGAADDVLDALEEYGVTELEYVVATHPHADHIGGMRKVIKETDVKHVLMPDVTHDSSTFEKLLLMIEQKGLEIDVPQPGDSFTLGSAQCTVLAPIGSEYSDLNDYSIVIMVEFAGRRVLFSGDSDRPSHGEMMQKWTDLSADVYKVAHHGSADNNTLDWISAISPAYAVISCDGVSYNHPHEETLVNLDAADVTIYRTDKDGSVTLTVDSAGEMKFETSGKD